MLLLIENGKGTHRASNACADVGKFVLGKRLRDLGVGSWHKDLKLALALRRRSWRLWLFGFNEVDMVSGEE